MHETHPQIERKFVRPGLISQYLKCPICLDVFSHANRLYCGHTFCAACLQDYMKSANTCPECRTRIQVKNIGVDLLARQIINELEVFCPSEDCPWKGLMQDLERHYFVDCQFTEQQATLGKKKDKKQDSTKIAWSDMVDDEVMDKINQNIAKGSLQARVMAKTNSTKIVMEVDHSNQSTALKELKGSKSQGMENAKGRQSSFNFLESLFG